MREQQKFKDKESQPELEMGLEGAGAGAPTKDERMRKTHPEEGQAKAEVGTHAPHATWQTTERSRRRSRFTAKGHPQVTWWDRGRARLEPRP